MSYNSKCFDSPLATLKAVKHVTIIIFSASRRATASPTLVVDFMLLYATRSCLSKLFIRKRLFRRKRNIRSTFLLASTHLLILLNFHILKANSFFIRSFNEKKIYLRCQLELSCMNCLTSGFSHNSAPTVKCDNNRRTIRDTTI